MRIIPSQLNVGSGVPMRTFIQKGRGPSGNLVVPLSIRGLGLISHHLLVQRSPPHPHLLSSPTQSTETKVRGTGEPWRWTCHVQPQLTASEGIWGTEGRWGYPVCSPICMWRELVSFPNKGISSQVIEDTKRTNQYLRDLVRNRGFILRTEKKTK